MAAIIILAGSIRIASGAREQALLHLRAMAAASRAEPGCLAFSFAFDVDDERLVRIFEVFESAEALAAHRASPHMAAWRAAWVEAGISDRRMAQYDVSEWRPI